MESETLNDGSVIIDKYEFKAMLALRDFSENIFCCYPENRGAEQEKNLHEAYAWTVRCFIDLIEASRKSFNEILQEESELIERKLKKQLTQQLS